MLPAGGRTGTQNSPNHDQWFCNQRGQGSSNREGKRKEGRGECHIKTLECENTYKRHENWLFWSPRPLLKHQVRICLTFKVTNEYADSELVIFRGVKETACMKTNGGARRTVRCGCRVSCRQGPGLVHRSLSAEGRSGTERLGEYSRRQHLQSSNQAGQGRN